MEFGGGVGLEMSEMLDILMKYKDSSPNTVGTCRFDNEVDIIASIGGVLMLAFAFNKRNSISETILKTPIFAFTAQSGIKTVEAVLLENILIDSLHSCCFISFNAANRGFFSTVF